MIESTSAVEDANGVFRVAAAGDIARMWEAFAMRLRGFVARRVPAGIEPDDVVQEVFVRVVRHLPSLRKADRVEGWLFQIARNALRDAMRARLRRDGRNESLEVDLPVAAGVEDEREAEAELAPCLTPLLARLAEPYRTAVELTSHQGLTQAEAAKRLGISISGTKSRVQRARRQLKEMLLQCCEVDVDSRGGVTDYRLHASARCPRTDDGAASEPHCARKGCGMRAWQRVRPLPIAGVFSDGTAGSGFAVHTRSK